MCLTLRYKNDKPYKPSTEYRFKRLNGFLGRYCSKFVRSFEWTLGRWRVAEFAEVKPGDLHTESDHKKDIGFHFFINKKPVLVKGDILGVYEVKDFVNSGHFGDEKCETWKRARLVAIYHKIHFGKTYHLIKSIDGYKGPKTTKLKRGDET